MKRASCPMVDPCEFQPDEVANAIEAQGSRELLKASRPGRSLLEIQFFTGSRKIYSSVSDLSILSAFRNSTGVIPHKSVMSLTWAGSTEALFDVRIKTSDSPLLPRIKFGVPVSSEGSVKTKIKVIANTNATRQPPRIKLE